VMVVGEYSHGEADLFEIAHAMNAPRRGARPQHRQSKQTENRHHSEHKQKLRQRESNLATPAARRLHPKFVFHGITRRTVSLVPDFNCWFSPTAVVCCTLPSARPMFPAM